MKYSKHFLLSFLMGIFLLAYSGFALAEAGEISAEDIAAIEAKELKTFKSETDVPRDKVWTVTFNEDVNIDALQDRQVIVWNRDLKEQVAVVTEAAGKELKIRPKIGGYDFSTHYSLYILEGVESKAGRLLKTAAKKDFTVLDEISYKEIIAPKYDMARDFSEGLAAVKVGEKWGYIDTKGNTVIDFQYDDAYTFSEGKALVKTAEKDPDGGTYTYLGFITKDNKYTPFTIDGRPEFEIIPFDQSNARFHNGLIAVTVDNPWKFIFDETGELYIDSPYLPTEGAISAVDNYIDQETGEYLFENPQFVNALPFNQGMAIVAFYDEELSEYYWSFINKKGETWAGPRFYNFSVREKYTNYKVFNEYSLASLKDTRGMWGAVNKEGQTKIPFIYDNLGPFSEGVASFEKKGKYGYIDVDGQVVIEAQFDEVSAFNEGIAAARIGDKAFIINKKGEMIKGTEKMPRSAYFREDGHNEDGSVNYITYTPVDYALFKEDGKYGFGKLEFNNITD
ncbi:WG repeat-containing protein [Sporosarcina obsidiansis]|uniref:WG repeat-containing protein n=1 Tax=Sporosarcina obsidiansis TaxID=2660748 RepID=UPI00129AA1C4|nr:WG repeat-containing protein [Sporosarcina obsidiansis]